MTNEPLSVSSNDLDELGVDSSSQMSSASTALLNASHPLTTHLDQLLKAPPSCRIAMAVGELATAMNHAARNEPFAVAVSAIEAGHKMGFTALTLAALWGRWGLSTCMIELGTGQKSLGGAIQGTSPDLNAACEQAWSGVSLNNISRLHQSLPSTGVIMSGQSDVLQLLSTGRLTRLITELKKDYDRIVLAAPSLSTGFPFLSLSDSCDRLIMSLLAGQSRSGPLRELAKHALLQGMRPIEVIWHDG